MTRKLATRSVLVALLVVAAAGQARAGQIIDQQNGPPPPGDASVSIPGGAPLGQSFTPSLTGIDFATFQIFDGAGVAGTDQVEVRSGFNGPLLGTSASVALPAGTGGFSLPGATIEFDFPSTIALTPGTLFSLMLVRVDSSSNFAAIGQGTGTYAGGVTITPIQSS